LEGASTGAGPAVGVTESCFFLNGIRIAGKIIAGVTRALSSARIAEMLRPHARQAVAASMKVTLYDTPREQGTPESLFPLIASPYLQYLTT
jgi:hypothetical protein